MPIKKIPDEVCECIYRLVLIIQDSPSQSVDLRWHKKMLTTAVRHLEYFVTPRVSKKAFETALSYGVKNLETMSWKPPSKWKLGKELIFEHALPASDIVKKLLSLKKPTLDDVLFELEKAEIVWIHRDEDKLLKKNNRGDWKLEYKNNNIVLID